MQYYSLHNPQLKVDFREATILGQAPDKGLFFPELIPTYSAAEWEELLQLSAQEMAFRIMQPYVGESIPASALQQIIAETLSFPFPMVPVTTSLYALELFHGPTLAFKDVGARFMSRCLGYFFQSHPQKVTVLVATSGDTGGAVASGFLGVAGVEVVILFPKGKVSPVQELQLTTCGQNISALAVEGSFDDCQFMVKEAFMDADLQKHRQLTSANSINVARWLPQQLYYILACQQWPKQLPLPVVSVPSGNFGNLCAGLVAWKSGLPVLHFIAACNTNDSVAAYLQGAAFSPQKAIPTISNAMDVGNPSNFIRILELFQQDNDKIRRLVSGYTISDADTKATIERVYRDYQYVLDPHGAVAMLALEKYLADHPSEAGIFLATAHPVKFPETVELAIGKPLEMPEAAKDLIGKISYSVPMAADFREFKNWLLSR
jgi:threonine synthase